MYVASALHAGVSIPGASRPEPDDDPSRPAGPWDQLEGEDELEPEPAA